MQDSDDDAVMPQSRQLQDSNDDSAMTPGLSDDEDLDDDSAVLASAELTDIADEWGTTDGNAADAEVAGGGAGDDDAGMSIAGATNDNAAGAIAHELIRLARALGLNVPPGDVDLATRALNLEVRHLVAWPPQVCSNARHFRARQVHINGL